MYRHTNYKASTSEQGSYCNMRKNLQTMISDLSSSSKLSEKSRADLQRMMEFQTTKEIHEKRKLDKQILISKLSDTLNKHPKQGT